jgi:PAS domain S-box-containing protein
MDEVILKNLTNGAKLDSKALESQIVELQLRESLLLQAINVATAGICVVDTNLRYVQINEWLANINGRSVDQHLGRSIRALYPALAAVIEPQLRHVIDTGRSITKMRVNAEISSQPDANRLLEYSYFANRAIDGSVVGVSCFVEDITERVRTEKDLAQSDGRYNLAVRATSDGIWDWDMVTNDLHCSPRCCEIIGFSGGDPDGLHDYEFWASRIHPDDREGVKESLKLHIDNGAKYDVNFRYRHESGDYCWHNSQGQVIFDDHRMPTRMIGCVRDITAQVRKEEELAQHRDHLEGLVKERTARLIESMKQQLDTETQYRSLVETANEMILVAQDEYVKYHNPQALKVTGYSAEDLASIPFINFVHPDDRDTVLNEYAARLSGESPTADYSIRILDKSGNVRWLLINSALIEWEGRPAALLMCTDITDRKMAELATGLQGRLLGEILAAGNSKQALKAGLIELAELFDWEYGEVWVPDEDLNTVRNVGQWHVPDKNIDKYAKLASGMILTKGHGLAGRVLASRQLEYGRGMDSWGEIDDSCAKALSEIAPQETLAVPIMVGDSVIAIFCFLSTVARDRGSKSEELIKPIALQIATAVQVKQSAEEYSHILESAPSCILITSRSGTILYANKEACRLFEYRSDELVGNKVEMLIPGKLRGKHAGRRDGFAATGIRKMGRHMELSGRKKDGSEFPIDISLNTHETLNGFRVIVIIADLQEQKKTLAALQSHSRRLQALTHHIQDLTEHERKSIARDLHDDMGQVLTSLKMDLAILKRKIGMVLDDSSDMEFDEDIAQMSDTIDRASQKMSKFITQLRPEILDHLGLIPTLDWQTEEFTDRLGIQAEFTSDVSILDLDDDTAIDIFRIVQECLTNVARHAEASQVKVHLSKPESGLYLEVSDNGRGIPEDTLNNNKRFGLLGMSERVANLGGSLEIKTKPGQGTKVCMSIPIEGNGQHDD